MHDHFCIAGPVHDPAGVRGAKSVSDGLMQIAKAGALFHSRADASATMWKERGLWQGMGLQPWEHLGDTSVPSWYKTSVWSPAEALKRADDEGAYLLTVNTFFFFSASQGRMDVEPRQHNSALLGRESTIMVDADANILPG